MNHIFQLEVTVKALCAQGLCFPEIMLGVAGKSPGCRAAGMQGCRAAGLQGCRDTAQMCLTLSSKDHHHPSVFNPPGSLAKDICARSFPSPARVINTQRQCWGEREGARQRNTNCLLLVLSHNSPPHFPSILCFLPLLPSPRSAGNGNYGFKCKMKGMSWLQKITALYVLTKLNVFLFLDVHMSY